VTCSILVLSFLFSYLLRAATVSSKPVALNGSSFYAVHFVENGLTQGVLVLLVFSLCTFNILYSVSCTKDCCSGIKHTYDVHLFFHLTYINLQMLINCTLKHTKVSFMSTERFVIHVLGIFGGSVSVSAVVTCPGPRYKSDVGQCCNL